ncbi:MAG: CDP-diacylglycerol--glycerol-3-phosphate 3-phosphatidyltransferase [FCB group bacterium]|nr:CDP-diacylglycerol--glycerol-3-phosphate 3-phosphatidyltransferase [FCB group bacterium]
MGKRHLPNLLTVGRILLTPLFLYFLFSGISHGKTLALIVFIIASITDAFDGRIARKYGVVTKVGVFLDPLADKFLVLSAFVSFWIFGEIKLWMLLLIAFRDVVVTVLRMIMQMKGFTMKTSRAGKLKTTLQMIVIHLILIYFVLNSYHWVQISHYFTEYHIIYILMIFTTAVTAYTGFHYFLHNYNILKLLFVRK